MVVEAAACALCGLPTHHPIEDEAGAVFCCPACREVSHLLAEDNDSRPKPALSETAVTQDLTFSLTGLWCPSCAWLIRANLEREPGVHDSDVSFIQREARIRYNPEQTNPRRLRKRVRRLGYRATLAGETPHDEEEAHWMRLLVSGVAAMHVMVLSFMLYIRQWTGRASVETEWLVNIFELMILAASVPVIIILGWPILRAGAASLMRGRPNTHTLIALGAFSAFGLSLRNLITGTGGLYFDTAAILLFLVALGRWFEMRAQKVSTTAVERLWEQVPPTAAWMTPEGEIQVSPEDLPLGARVRVRPGERFPVDGVIAVGEGDVDESLLTGEPEPVPRRAGERVLAGTISLDGSFELLTTAVGAETVVGQIGRLLHQALWQRAPVEQMADKLAALMVPTAVLLSALTFAFWTRQADLETGLIYALSVLLIACPCALGIATPLTLWLGLGRAAESGVILRQTAVWERLARAEHIFFDKTGTLTQRPLRLQGVAVEGVAESDFLAWVTAVETASEHPIGQAIAAGGREKLGDAPLPSVAEFRIWPGQGVSGAALGTTLFVGNGRLMQEQMLLCPPTLAEQAAHWQEQGMMTLFAGWRGRVRGVLALAETIRPGAAQTLAQLQELGLSVAILTGDDAQAGKRWQRELGVPVFAGLHPKDKAARLNQTENGIMVGDGINDGPALAAADVGVAVSVGADVAQAAADAVLITGNLAAGNLAAIPWLVQFSRLTMRKVRQNLAWAFFYNLIGLALAVSGRLQPEVAALFMVASNLIVTSNALQLRKQPLAAAKKQ